MKKFNPQLLIISAGFDGYHSDPIGGELGLSTDDYIWCTKQVSTAHVRCYLDLHTLCIYFMSVIFFVLFDFFSFFFFFSLILLLLFVLIASIFEFLNFEFHRCFLHFS